MIALSRRRNLPRRSAAVASGALALRRGQVLKEEK
jgi:hypothetical protein